MAQVITIAGERLFALKAQNNQQLDIDTFIFANVPGQDSTTPIDRNEGLPPVGQRVHTQIVQQTALINDNAVVYSSVLDSLTGPFQFNWVGLYSSVNQTLIAVSHIPTVTKTVTAPGAAGNILNRNFVIEYSGIGELTGITVAPETWQLDYTSRLNGMDELTRQLAADMNGKDWFIDDGFKVVPRGTVNTFKVTTGVGYVSGLRVALEAEQVLTLSSYPQFVYVDAWFDGTSESVWAPKTAFTVTNGEMDDYIDVSGKSHYVVKIARVNSADSVDDLRNTNGIAQKIDKQQKSDLKSIILYDGGPEKSGADNLAALRKAKAQCGEVFFPSSGGDTRYLVDGITAADFDSLKIYSDANVTISLDNDDYLVNRGAEFKTNVNLHYRNRNFDFVAVKNDKATAIGGVKNAVVASHIDGVTEYLSPFELFAYEFDNGTDNFIDISYVDNGYSKKVSAFNGKTAGLFTNIEVGQTISAHVRNDVFSGNDLGICIKSNSGYYLVTKDPLTNFSNIQKYRRFNGVDSSVEQLSYPFQNKLTSYELQNSVISVTRVSISACYVSINGTRLNEEFIEIGDISEVGFIAISGGSDVNIEIVGISSQKSKIFKGFNTQEQLLIYGDSMAADFHGAFEKHVKEVMVGVDGTNVITIVNRAVAGTQLSEIYQRMQDDGLSNYLGNYVIVVGLTNDMQANIPVADSEATLSNIISYIEFHKKRLIFIEPSLWYPKAIVDNVGVDTARYEFGAGHRAMAQYTVSARRHIYVRTTQIEPVPDYRLVGTENDPIIRDNMHPSCLGNQLKAKNAVEHLLFDMARIRHDWSTIPKRWFKNGWTSLDGAYRVVDGAWQISGSFHNEAPLIEASEILKLPKVGKPRNFPAMSTDLVTSGVCYVSLDSNGSVTLRQISSTAHNTVIMDIKV
ncbi:phage tail protein [Shewanella baltica]|uniref:phage tail-collar fiber domain-containing protein n=1 Tax=Shewanella baltica TaxID=62322 RepID=UPI0030CE629F